MEHVRKPPTQLEAELVMVGDRLRVLPELRQREVLAERAEQLLPQKLLPAVPGVKHLVALGVVGDPHAQVRRLLTGRRRRRRSVIEDERQSIPHVPLQRRVEEPVAQPVDPGQVRDAAAGLAVRFRDARAGEEALVVREVDVVSQGHRVDVVEGDDAGARLDELRAVEEALSEVVRAARQDVLVDQELPAAGLKCDDPLGLPASLSVVVCWRS